MPASEQADRARSLPQVVPTGSLLTLSIDEIKPSAQNPRRLFDPEPLAELKDSIRQHGVLVPLTLYKLPGQTVYGIVDGERRYRCCVQLAEDGHQISIPANIVEPPDPKASLIYMFNIHAFREQWELMPTALSLKELIDAVGTEDDDELHEITGLSMRQIERCKLILSYPTKFQQMSLQAEQKDRIPSNFWVELYPVLEKIATDLPDLYHDLGRDQITMKLVDKYHAKKIKSVIHFRRILEAFEVAGESEEEDLLAVRDKLREYVLTEELETREAFDGFIRDARKVQRAVDACDKFVDRLSRAKIDLALDGREEILIKLREVIDYVQNLIDSLEAGDPPETDEDGDLE